MSLELAKKLVCTPSASYYEDLTARPELESVAERLFRSWDVCELGALWGTCRWLAGIPSNAGADSKNSIDAAFGAPALCGYDHWVSTVCPILPVPDSFADSEMTVSTEWVSWSCESMRVIDCA